MKNTGIILLAAGNSARMGFPKQLLPFQGKTLLNRIIDTTLQIVEPGKIVIVLGANHQRIGSEITNTNLLITINEDWKDGMGSSIKAGLEKLLEYNPNMQKCFISVCDQPHLSSQLFLKMHKMAETTSKEIIAAEYADTMGVPVLFSKNYFEKLLKLNGEQGAKKIINQNQHDVATISFEKGDIDIDTPSDYEQLKKNYDQRTGS